MRSGTSGGKKKKKKKHSQKSIHSHLLETSGCTCLPGPPPICWAAWNGTPPWCRSPLRPSCPPLWMDGALRPTVQQSAGCRGEEQAAPLTRSFQLTQESSHLNLTVTQHINFRWGWIRPDQLCLQNPIKKKILSLNRFAIDLLNINLHYLFIYLFFSTTNDFDENTVSLLKNTRGHHVSCNTKIKIKDEVELEGKDSHKGLLWSSE